ncbi:MAG: cytochrome c [Nitrospirae bacterium]|nr:MAG: cytochrome c [Nitrospirota bacterium]
MHFDEAGIRANDREIREVFYAYGVASCLWWCSMVFLIHVVRQSLRAERSYHAAQHNPRRPSASRTTRSDPCSHARGGSGMGALGILSEFVRCDHRCCRRHPRRNPCAVCRPPTFPAGWANDPKILDAGKALYHGEAISSVNCAICHGKDGKPTPIARNAPDFSDPAYSQKSDAWLFWRISEGVPKTMMRGWKDFLSEEQRWQIIAYIRSLAKPS